MNATPTPALDFVGNITANAIDRTQGGSSANYGFTPDNINSFEGDLILQATNNIHINLDITKAKGNLTLDAGNHIFFRDGADLTLSESGATLTLITGQDAAKAATGRIRGFANGSSISVSNLIVEFASVQFNSPNGLGAQLGTDDAGKEGVALTNVSSLTIRTAFVESATTDAASTAVQVHDWMFASGRSLTIEAPGGSVNFTAVGSLGTGALDVSAGGSNGRVFFPSSGTLAASGGITLNQAIAYQTTAPSITFSTPPILTRTGGESVDVSWGVEPATATPRNITINSTNNTMSLEQILNGAFAVDDDGLLDLTTFALTINAAFTLPTELTEIRAGTIRISAKVTSAASGLKLISAGAMTINATVELTGAGDLVLAAQAITLSSTAVAILRTTGGGNTRVSSAEGGTAATETTRFISTGGDVYLSGGFNFGTQTLTLRANAGTIGAAGIAGEAGHGDVVTPSLTAGSLEILAKTLTLRNWMQPTAREDNSVTITIAAGGQLTLVENYNFIDDASQKGTILTITAPQVVVDIASTEEGVFARLSASDISITASATGTGSAAAFRNTDNESLIINSSFGSRRITIDARNIDFAHSGTGGDFTMEASSSRAIFANSQGTTIKARDLGIIITTVDALAGAVKKNLTLEATRTLSLSGFESSATAINVADITLISANRINAGGSLTITATGDINLNASVVGGTGASLTLIAGATGSINFGGTSDITINTTTGEFSSGAISLTSPVKQDPPASVGVSIQSIGASTTLSGHFTLANDKHFQVYAGAEGVPGKVIFATTGPTSGTRAHSITAGSILIRQSDEYTQTDLNNWSFDPLPTARRNAVQVPIATLTWDNAVPVVAANIVLATGDGNLGVLIVGKFALSGGTLDLGSRSLIITTSGTLTIPASITTIETSGGTITLNAGTIVLGHSLTLRATNEVAGAVITIGADLDAGTSGDLMLQVSSVAVPSSTIAFSKDVVLSGNDISVTSSDGVNAGGFDLTFNAKRNLDLGGAAYTLGTGDLTLSLVGAFTAPSAITAGDLTITKTNSGLGDIHIGSWIEGASGNVSITAARARVDFADSFSLCNEAFTTCGNLTVLGRTIRFNSTTGTNTINAGVISLTANSGGEFAINNVGNTNVTLNARTGDLTINAFDIDLVDSPNPAKTLILSASGTISFARAAGTAVASTNITLDAQTIASAGNLVIDNVSSSGNAGITFINNPRITVQGNLTLKSPRAQSSGNLSVTLIANARAAANGVAAANGDITLTGAFDFGTGGLDITYDGAITGPTTLTTANLFITSNDRDIAFAAWMAPTSGNRNLTLDAGTGNISEVGTINLGTGNLTLEANMIRLAATGPYTITAGNVTLTAGSTGAW